MAKRADFFTFTFRFYVTFAVGTEPEKATEYYEGVSRIRNEKAPKNV
jgi:hypothetical protein